MSFDNLAKKKNHSKDWINGSLWNRDALCEQHSGLWLFNFSEASMLRGLLLILDQLVCFQHNCWTAPVASAALLFAAVLSRSAAPLKHFKPNTLHHALMFDSNQIRKQLESFLWGILLFSSESTWHLCSQAKAASSVSQRNVKRRHFVLLTSSFLKLDMVENLFVRQRSSAIHNLP